MKKYKDLFELIDNTIKKQNAQKKRGLNNYNMVNVVRKATHEVGMHSNIIYSLINPNGEHFQGKLFLYLFIEKVLMPELELDSIEDFGEVYSVQAEESTEKNRRIDFTIKSDNYLIGIEMKVNAADLSHQISDYYKHLKEESHLEGEKKVFIFYLTKYGKSASEESHKGICYKKISFKENILNWIDASLKEVNNITNLNIALRNYREIVEKITNQYKGNVVSVEEELLDNKEALLLALELDKSMGAIKGGALYNFFEEITKFLDDEGYKTDGSILNNYSYRLLDKDKCLAYYKKSRPRFFGKAFTLSDEKFLYVYVAINSLCFTVIDNSKLKDGSTGNEFGNENISEDNINKKYLAGFECYKRVNNNLHGLIKNQNDFKTKLLKYVEKNGGNMIKTP